MAALNITETEALRAAMSKISGTARRLREERPLTQRERDTLLEILKQAEDNIKMVVTLKGHYPK